MIRRTQPNCRGLLVGLVLSVALLTGAPAARAEQTAAETDAAIALEAYYFL